MAVSFALEVDARLNNQLAGQLTQVSRQMSEMSKIWSTLFVAREISEFGSKLTSLFSSGVTAAGNFERAMANIRIATRGTREDMKALGQTVLEVSNRYAMSNVQAASMLGVLARGGMDAAQLTKMADPIAAFGNVMNITRHQGFEESTVMASRLAGMLGKNDAQGLTDTLNNFAKASNLVKSENLSDLFEIIKNFSPAARAGHMDDRQIMMMGAFLENTGQGGRGGTALNQALFSLDKESARIHQGRIKDPENAAVSLGLLDRHGTELYRDSRGNVDPVQMIRLMVDAAKHDPQARGDFISSFGGVRGARFAALGADPETLKALEVMQAKWNELMGVTAANAVITDTFNQQLSIMKTNFTSLSVNVFQPMLPMLTSAVKGLGELAEWVSKLGPAERAVLTVLAGSAGLVGVLGIVTGKFVTLVSTIALFNMAMGAGGAASALTLIGSLTAALPAIAAVTAALGLLAVAGWQVSKLVDANKGTTPQEFGMDLSRWILHNLTPLGLLGSADPALKSDAVNMKALGHFSTPEPTGGTSMPDGSTVFNGPVTIQVMAPTAEAANSFGRALKRAAPRTQGSGGSSPDRTRHLPGHGQPGNW